jgi:Hemolysins and related proteins containing CBS domains
MRIKKIFKKILFLLVERNIHSKTDIIEIISKTKILKQSDKQLALSALSFSETKLSSVMIPKNKITFIRETAHLGPKVLDELYSTGQKIFPIAHKSLEDTVGVIYLEDITEVAKGEQTLQQATHLRPPIISQNMPVNDVLFEMLSKNASLVLVEDIDNKIVGMVELSTILSKLLGK